MKIILLGDTHFGARNDSPLFHKAFEKFYSETFFPYIDQHGITTIIQLGDVFDRRKYINFASLAACKKYFFTELSKRNIITYIICGNHDTYYKNTNEVNSLDLLLRQYSNIKYYYEPTEIQIEDVKFAMLPWICNDNELDCLNFIRSTDARLLIGHLELSGFEMYKGAVIHEGMEASLFEQFDAVYTGHYHHKSSQRNIHYLGTPYEMTWSDYNDQKGFHVLDLDTKQLDFVPNPNVMFFKHHYDDANKTFDDVLAFDFEKYKDAFVKVIVRNKTNPYWFDMVIEKMEKAGVADLQVVDDHFHLDLEDDDDIINEAEDTLTIIKKHINQLGESVDKPKLESLLRSLYDEALALE